MDDAIDQPLLATLLDQLQGKAPMVENVWKVTIWSPRAAKRVTADYLSVGSN